MFRRRHIQVTLDRACESMEKHMHEWLANKARVQANLHRPLVDVLADLLVMIHNEWTSQVGDC